MLASGPRGHQIDRFADTAAILISIVSNSYYGMLWGQIHIHLPPEHPIMSFETIEIKMAALSAKRFINKLDCYFYLNYLQGWCRTRQQDHGGQQTTP